MAPDNNHNPLSDIHCTKVRERIHKAVSSRDYSDAEAAKGAALRELYRHHPEITLADILELRVLISVPETKPDAQEVGEYVKAVLSEALERHDQWTSTERSSTLGTNSTTVATKGDR